MRGLDSWLSRGHDVDRSLPACADCDTPLTEQPVVVYDSQRRRLFLCDACAVPFLEDEHRADETPEPYDLAADAGKDCA